MSWLTPRDWKVPPIIQGRVEALGEVGRWLATSLDGVPVDKGLDSMSCVRLLARGWGPNTRQRVAISLLCLSVPAQVKIDRFFLRSMLSLRATQYRRVRNAPDLAAARKNDVDVFPLKPDRQAATKVNVFFRHVIKSVAANFPVAYGRIRRAPHFLDGLYNDQASAAVMYAALIMSRTSWGLDVVGRLCSDHVFGKQVTLVLKACGTGQDSLLPCLVETTTLAGRGVGDIDLRAEAEYRTRRDALNVVEPDEDELRRAVHAVVSREIGGRKIELEPVDEYYSRRWLTTVNGAHSKRVHNREGVAPIPEALRGLRLHRRVGAEVFNSNPIDTWNGEVDVGVSAKLEPGKRRALFACDTISYMAFDYLQGPIEKAWRNKVAILDPGKGGHLGMVKRMEAATEGRYAVMLDYDDFNSQHSIRSQQIVYEEVFRVYGNNPVATKCIQSLDKMRIWHDNELVGIAAGTLMSGHRGTSMVNTILNAAYLEMYIGMEMDGAHRLHVGDDILMAVRSQGQASAIVNAIKSTPLRFNALKQSWGNLSCEFLRISGWNGRYYGYLARCISTIVAGNWVNDIRLREVEAASTYAQMCWTLVNRSGVPTAGTLLSHVMSFRLKLSHETAHSIALGAAGLNGSPVRRGWNVYSRYRVEDVGSTALAADMSGYPRNATNDYLSLHSTQLEREVIEHCGGDVVRLMMAASYNKTLSESGTLDSEFRVRRDKKLRRNRRVVNAAEFVAETQDEPLRGHPLVSLFKGRLRAGELSRIMRNHGMVYSPEELERYLNPPMRGVISCALLSYSDLMALSGKVDEGVEVIADVSVAV